MPIDSDRWKSSLIARLTACDLPADSAFADRLCVHAKLLEEWSQRMNLVGLADTDQWIEDLYVDSARLLPALAGVVGPIVDLGSGAGFPGLVIAAADPNREVMLVDSINKKCSFLAAAAEAMGLPKASAHPVRLEELGSMMRRRETFGAAVFKALGPWAVGLELAMPLVKPLGRVVFLQGKDAPPKVGLESVVERLGGGTATCVAYGQPDRPLPRHIVTVVKTGRTSTLYPRGVGVPAKKPLWVDTDGKPVAHPKK